MGDAQGVLWRIENRTESENQIGALPLRAMSWDKKRLPYENGVGAPPAPSFFNPSLIRRGQLTIVRSALWRY